jgi:uncharacterized membrane protein
MKIIIPTAAASIVVVSTLVFIALRDHSLVPVFVMHGMIVAAIVAIFILERKQRRALRDAERYERVTAQLADLEHDDRRA